MAATWLHEIRPELRWQEATCLCRDAEHGEKEDDPKPRYDEYMAEDWVEYVKLDTAQNTYRALNKIWANQPVLLKGTPLVAGLVGRWGMQQLVRVLRRRVHQDLLLPLPEFLCMTCYTEQGGCLWGHQKLALWPAASLTAGSEGALAARLLPPFHCSAHLLR